MIEMLCLITNAKDDKKIKNIVEKYTLPFNLAMYGKGTASSSLLNYFGLEEIRKYIYFSLIDYNQKNSIFSDIDNSLNLNKPGHGILFTVPISSSTKHIREKIYEVSKEDNMENEKLENKKNYELVIAVVNEGHSESVMNAAKSKGAGGGTLIKGRSLLQNSSKNKFLGITIEPEKDIVLIVVDSSKKKEIMEAIVEKSGLKTKGNGIVFSLPIDDAIGLYE